MGVGSNHNRLVSAWFGGIAMAVQVLLPFLLAAEIRLADAGELPSCAPSAATEASVPVTHRTDHSGTSHHGGPHNGTAACPICQAMACGQAVADTASPPALALPQDHVSTAEFEFFPQFLTGFYSSSYRARAPPTGV